MALKCHHSRDPGLDELEVQLFNVYMLSLPSGSLLLTRIHDT